MNQSIKLTLTLLAAAMLVSCSAKMPDDTYKNNVDRHTPVSTDGKTPSQPDFSAEKAESEAEGKTDTHIHTLATVGNEIEHEPFGYCGNTITKIRAADATNADERSFWGGDSVELTDLLRFLDYSEPTCKCLPEYTVDTEFESGYGINLTEGYARHGDGQAQFTAEQLAAVRNIINRVYEIDAVPEGLPETLASADDLDRNGGYLLIGKITEPEIALYCDNNATRNKVYIRYGEHFQAFDQEAWLDPTVLPELSADTDEEGVLTLTVKYLRHEGTYFDGETSSPALVCEQVLYRWENDAWTDIHITSGGPMQTAEHAEDTSVEGEICGLPLYSGD